MEAAAELRTVPGSDLSQMKAIGTLNQTKKIAYVLHLFPRVTDTFIKREIRALQRRGTDISVISVWKPPPSDSDPAILAEWANDTAFALPRSALAIGVIVVRSMLGAPAKFMRTAWTAVSTANAGLRGLLYQSFYFVEAVLVADILERKSIDHVHNHGGDQSGTVAMLAAQLAGIDYSISFHGPHIFIAGKNNGLKRKILDAKFNRAISYFCSSQLMLFSDGSDPSFFKIVHCGLDLNRYKFRLPGRSVNRIFCAARLAHEKGISILVRAIAALKAAGHDFELRLAGNGPSRDEIESEIRSLGVTSDVRLLGFLNEGEIAAELHAADLFVLPSFAEGIPVSVMEAMAIGVPAIATNIAGIGELIEHEKSGLLVRPADVDALAEAILRIASDETLRSKIAMSAREKIVKEFDIEIEAGKLQNYFVRD
jgi:colanic acid/amylovoran biosynthesis glycosyltransferase